MPQNVNDGDFDTAERERVFTVLPGTLESPAIQARVYRLFQSIKRRLDRISKTRPLTKTETKVLTQASGFIIDYKKDID